MATIRGILRALYPRRGLFWILLLALALRLVGFGWGSPGPDHLWPYHPDESKLFLGLKAFPPTFHPYDIATGGSFFGLYGLHTAVGAVLGLYPLAPAEGAWRGDPTALSRLFLWNRLLTVVVSTLTAALVYAVARKGGLSERGRCLAALLFALAPFSVLHAKYVTPHTLTAFLWVVSLYFLTRPTRPGAAGFVLTAGAASEYSLGAAWLAASAFVRRRGDLLWYVGASLVGLPLFFSILVDPAGWWEVLRQSGAVRPGALGLGHLFSIFGVAMGFLPLGGGIGGVVLWMKRTPSVRPPLVVAAIFLAALVLVLGNPYARRYAPLYPVLALGAAYLLEGVSARGLWLVAALALLSEPTLRTVSVLNALSTSDTRTIAREEIDRRIPPGTTIALQNWFFAPHLDDERYEIVLLPKGELPPDTVPYVLTTEFNKPFPRDLRAAGFEEVFRVERPHRIGPFVFDDATWPEDMRYTNPGIYLYRRPPRG